MKNKNVQRKHRKLRIRAKVNGTETRPRLAVFRSNAALYVQVINDEIGKTLFSDMLKGATIANAKVLGTTVVAHLKKEKITTVVFDRSGYRYHGVVKSLAESVREGGIIV